METATDDAASNAPMRKNHLQVAHRSLNAADRHPSPNPTGAAPPYTPYAKDLTLGWEVVTRPKSFRLAGRIADIHTPSSPRKTLKTVAEWQKLAIEKTTEAHATMPNE